MFRFCFLMIRNCRLVQFNLLASIVKLFEEVTVVAAFRQFVSNSAKSVPINSDYVSVFLIVILYISLEGWLVKMVRLSPTCEYGRVVFVQRVDGIGASIFLRQIL